jgi:hypothetical protein
MKEDTITKDNVYKQVKKAIKLLNKNKISNYKKVYVLYNWVGEWLLENWDSNVIMIPNPINTYGCTVYIFPELLKKFEIFAKERGLKINYKELKEEKLL